MSVQVSSEQEAPTTETVSQWALNLDKKLFDLNMIFGIVNSIYQAKVKDRQPSVPGLTFKYEELNELELVKEMAESLSHLLGKHVRALEKSVEAAEKLASDYKWNVNLKKDDVVYMNSKELKQKEVNLTYDDNFKRDVNFDFSSVHIPVEIYDGNIDILNGLNWTAELDQQFKKNQEEDPDILWQYFGSQTGFLRSYPAAMWPSEGVDLYDVRRRSWYTQGSSSPKDMMILIDISGSTHGQSLQLMQNTVKSILDTLGENDYVNIVEFAEQARFVSRCFNHTAFVQANYRNKQRLMKDIDKLMATGQADFSEAVRFAFEKFIEFNDNGSNPNNVGANCNKVIMLLTDGGTDNAEDVFAKYNWPNKTVRVFTYAVGATPNPVKALRWMACANRGYFSQIPAMGAIRARVQEYTKHLREMEAAESRNIQWEITYDPRELGMMTTVTRPVYNYSRDSSNQTILGVMAIDVTTKQLEDKTPYSKIGPNGYSFAINPNGYVVFHPNLYTSGKFMTEPPNIDLLELEVDQNNKDLQDLRSAMIEGNNGSATISTYFLSPDQRYVTNDQADYGYVSITNTSFRLGLCVPTYQKKYPKFHGDISKFNWSSGFSSAFSILIAPWDYHKHMQDMDDLTGTLSDITKLLQEDSDPKHWNLDLLYHLYWDVLHIEPHLVLFLRNLHSFENTTETSNSTQQDDIQEHQSSRTFFIMTNGGMTLVSPASETEYFQKEQDLRNSSIFKRALRTTKCIFKADYTKDKRQSSAPEPYVMTACGTYIAETNNQKQEVVVDKPAVAGQRLSHETVLGVLIDSSNTSKVDMSCDSSYLLCYLVDDGGFLVATTGSDYREQIGRFFGEVDPSAFAFVEKNFFLRTVQYDFQATCKEMDNINSSGFRDSLIPSMNAVSEFLSLGWWTSTVNWAFTSFSMYSWFDTLSTKVYADDDGDDDDDDDRETKEKKCVKATYQFYINVSAGPLQDVIQCHDCSRTISAVKLNKTNLLLIVAENKSCEECDELYKPVTQASQELSEAQEENIVCDMALNPWKRVRAYECHHSDPREDSSECACSALRSTCLLRLVSLVSVVWRLSWR